MLFFLFPLHYWLQIPEAELFFTVQIGFPKQSVLDPEPGTSLCSVPQRVLFACFPALPCLIFNYCYSKLGNLAVGT